jgi:hypothetical protein
MKVPDERHFTSSTASIVPKTILAKYNFFIGRKRSQMEICW